MNRRRFALDDANLPIGADNAKLRIVGLFAPYPRLGLFVHSVPVLRMHPFFPRLLSVWMLLRVQTVEPVHPVVPDQLAGAQVQFTNPEPSSIGRHIQPPPSAVQLFQVLLLLRDVVDTRKDTELSTDLHRLG